VIPITRLLSLILCSLALCSVASADEQGDLQILRERIISMQRELDNASESKSEAADALRESESAISDSNR